ncbi:glycosyltransferase [Candidatus Roizmanbacteria bacterium]|nr:glycosyltransferase [Candidatus Roizmanbacteria bacterium]
MAQNYLHLVKKTKIQKKNDIVINIPTYYSYQTTKKTLKLLYKQKGVNFDILIIDNNSNDYYKLSKEFSELNYLVLKYNSGSSGAQRIGIELALKLKYKYIVCTDNDAILLENDGILKLYKKLTSNSDIDCVVPKPIKSNNRKDLLWNRQLPLHYLFFKSKALEKIELHNFYLFLLTDDISLTSKIVSKGKILIASNTSYYHPFKPKHLDNVYSYFYIRGLLIIIFLEKGISFKLKIYHSLHLFYRIILCFLYSIELKDVSYLKNLFLAFKNFLTNYKKIDFNIPKNKYCLKETKVKEHYAYKFTSLNILFLKKYYYLDSYHKKIFLELTKNE